MLLHKSAFSTVVSHNDVCITQYMCHIMILIHECYMIKDESNKSSNDILVFLSRKGLEVLNPFCMQAWQNPPLCRRTRIRRILVKIFLTS